MEKDKLVLIHVLENNNVFTRQVKKSELEINYKLIEGQEDLYEPITQQTDYLENSKPFPSLEKKGGPFDPDSLKKYSSHDAIAKETKEFFKNKHPNHKL